MYLLDDVTKEIQKERLHEAEIERMLKAAKRPAEGLQGQLLNRLGDWLIINGLKLKGQYVSPGEIVWKEC